jgi:exportin-1
MLPLSTDIKAVYSKGSDDEQKFIQNLAMFLASYLKEHVQIVEKSGELHEYLASTLHYVTLISQVDETEIFKICLEFWNTLSSELYLEHPFKTYPATTSYFPSTLMKSPYESQAQTRRKFYDATLSTVRCIMIERMAKPEEVLVVENDQGEVVREFMKDTDSINMYKLMRETLGKIRMEF